MKGVKMINIHKLDNVEALIENPTQPQPVATPRPVEGARPGVTPTPSTITPEEGVVLACRLYRMSEILNLLYQPLYSINFDPIFLSLSNENDRVSSLALDISRSLGGRNNCSCQRLPLPILGGTLCTGFRVTNDYLDDMLTVANSLLRGGFDRTISEQINQIIALINSQKNAIEIRIINCRN